MTLQRIRKTGAGVLIIAIAVLLAFSSCSQAKNEIPGSVKSISVRIEDGTGARTITPEGNVDITHYEITVHNDAENLHQKSGYLTKGSMFSVSNVPAGTWYAVVDAYVYRQGNNPEYVKVASATSEPKAVTEGSSTTLTVLLNSSSLLNDLSGSVTVTLKMPSALAPEGTAFRYQYRIIGMTDSEFSRESAILSGNTGADGSASVVIDAETYSLVQGSYRLEITVFDGENEAGSTVVRKGVDVMRLLPGLPAAGTIDLNSYEADQDFGITITDRIGNLLTPSLVGDGTLYELDSETGNSLTVTLSKPLTDNETIEWYVSGILDESVDVSQAESGKYTLSFNLGSYSVTAVVRDTETAMAVGSIEPFSVRVTNYHFSVSIAGISEKFVKGVDPLSRSVLQDTTISIDDGYKYMAVGLNSDGELFSYDESGQRIARGIDATTLVKTVETIEGQGAFPYMLKYLCAMLFGLYSTAPDQTLSSVGIVPYDPNCTIGSDSLSGVEIYKIDVQKFNPSFIFDVSEVDSFDFTAGFFMFSTMPAALINENGTLDLISEFESMTFEELFILTGIGEDAPSLEGNPILSMAGVDFDETMSEWMARRGYEPFVIPFDNRESAEEFIDSLGAASDFSAAFALVEAKLAEKKSIPAEIGDGAALTGLSYVDNEGKEHSIFYWDNIVTGEVPAPEITQSGHMVEIACSNPFAEVYYTTDGSDPKTNGTLYTGEFQGQAGQTIKAATIKAAAKISEAWSEESILELQLFTFEANDDVEGGSWTVTGTVEGLVQPDSAKFEIPSTYKGLPVTRIAGDAFSDRTDITGTLVLPQSLIEIEGGYYFNGKTHGAFSGCTGLTGALIIPDSVTSIGSAAFRSCTSFNGTLTIGSDVETIGDFAFRDCSGFTGSLNIPDSVTLIGAYAFYGCSSFTGNLVIPDSVTSIGNNAFQACSGFTGNLVISNSVTSIGNCAFRNCSGFNGSLEIPDNVTSIGSDAFENCTGFNGTLKIGSKVETIGSQAFSGCSSFTGSLVIPDSVTSIGNNAFQACSGFTGNLVISNSVTSIGYYAFYGCTGFESLELSASLKEIGQGAFYNCTGLKGEITIPEGFTTFSVYDTSYLGAFENCSGITFISFPSTLEVIKVNRLIRGCSSLTGTITIPATCVIEEPLEFTGCNAENLQVYHGDILLWPTT